MVVVARQMEGRIGLIDDRGSSFVLPSSPLHPPLPLSSLHLTTIHSFSKTKPWRPPRSSYSRARTTRRSRRGESRGVWIGGAEHARRSTECRRLAETPSFTHTRARRETTNTSQQPISTSNTNTGTSTRARSSRPSRRPAAAQAAAAAAAPRAPTRAQDARAFAPSDAATCAPRSATRTASPFGRGTATSLYAAASRPSA